jgi:hypothetical protein
MLIKKEGGKDGKERETGIQRETNRMRREQRRRL